MQDLLDRDRLHWAINDYAMNQRVPSCETQSVFLKLGAWVQFFAVKHRYLAWSSEGIKRIAIWNGIFEDNA